MASETCVTAFRDAIRERDRRCIVTGRAIYAEFGVWRTFQAAHIFPLAYGGHWTANSYVCWITIQPEDLSTQSRTACCSTIPYTNLSALMYGCLVFHESESRRLIVTLG